MSNKKFTVIKALYYTGNQSAEAAASYVFDNPDIDVMPPLVKTKHSKKKSKKDSKDRDSEESDEDGVSTDYKMVFVVNTALGMGVGKIASQVAHACLGVYKLINEFKYMTDIVSDWEEEG